MKKPTPDQWMGIVLGLMVVLITSLVVMNLSASDFKGIAPLGRGEQMPALEGPDLAGQKLTLAPGDTGGKVLLVDFWATWCPPCREELPVLADLHQRYGAKGLRFIAVNTDAEGSQAAQSALVKSFLQQQNLDLPVLLDDGHLQGRFNVQSLPSLFLVGRDGNIREIYVGFASPSTIERAVKKALEES